MKTEDYDFYLDLRRYGGVEHAGFGLGLDRIVMYVTGMTNIRAWAFGGCDQLTELITGNGVKISPLAFEKRPIDR